jgi:hypothetical protein
MDASRLEVDFGQTSESFAVDAIHDFRARCELVKPGTHAKQGAIAGFAVLGGIGAIFAVVAVAADDLSASAGDAVAIAVAPALVGALVGGLVGAAYPKRLDWKPMEPGTAVGRPTAPVMPVQLSLHPTPGEPGAWSVGLRVPVGG